LGASAIRSQRRSQWSANPIRDQQQRCAFNKFGSGQIRDPCDNAIAAAYKVITEGILFEWVTHKKATLSDLYLIHQQGWEGAAQHMRIPAVGTFVFRPAYTATENVGGNHGRLDLFGWFDRDRPFHSLISRLAIAFRPPLETGSPLGELMAR
jgi:hypothetical protein